MGKTKLSEYGAADHLQASHQSRAAINFYRGGYDRQRSITIKTNHDTVIDQPNATRPRSELTVDHLTSLHFLGESRGAHINSASLHFFPRTRHP